MTDLTPTSDAIEAYASLAEIEEIERAQRRPVLAKVESRVDCRWYADIQRCIADSDRTHSFSIVSEPSGREEIGAYVFGRYYVDQDQDGGNTGDNFAGRICISIGSGDYLESHYVT